jgi:hypothetical protein
MNGKSASLHANFPVPWEKTETKGEMVAWFLVLFFLMLFLVYFSFQ